jgi:hypothetical protein
LLLKVSRPVAMFGRVDGAFLCTPPLCPACHISTDTQLRVGRTTVETNMAGYQ